MGVIDFEFNVVEALRSYQVNNVLSKISKHKGAFGGDRISMIDWVATVYDLSVDDFCANNRGLAASKEGKGH